MGAPESLSWLVWDRSDSPPPGEASCILWRSFPAPGEEVHSIPAHLETNAVRLRARYLEWVHELGQGRAGDGTVIQKLAIRPRFSFWWMTLLVEKSNAFNSPQIINALKLFALEEIVGTGHGRVLLASADATLARAMRGWCANAGRAFEWRRLTATVKKPREPRHFARRLPWLLQGLARLVQRVITQRALRGAGIASVDATGAQVTFCSYLFNLDRRAAADGRLGDSYWTDLHGLLAANDIGTNWLFQFVPHDFVADAARARELIESFNRNGAHRAHVPLDAALDLRAAWRALRDYIRIRARSSGLATRARFRPRDSALDLWPLFERDWRDSLAGAAAMASCIDLNLFESILGRLPRQRLGLYLLENVGWEMAFVHCWQAAGHGRLVGVPHSTVRFWDLRYHHDRREFARDGDFPLPLPDLVAVNGPVARASLLGSGFPAERLREVEALRFLYLNSAEVPRASVAGASLRVLVLGDYMRAPTEQQLQWLSIAARELPPDTRYIVKPHPACPVLPADFPELRFTLTDQPLAELLGDCDVAFTSNMTSAAVDAAVRGVRVISALDGEQFNTSPLRGIDAVEYVTNPRELSTALARAGRAAPRDTPGFFHLDRGLPRWRELLGLREATTENFRR
jgi:surface carbohydrate biosynthesis protein (TIGR04326 family)